MRLLVTLLVWSLRTVLLSLPAASSLAAKGDAFAGVVDVGAWRAHWNRRLTRSRSPRAGITPKTALRLLRRLGTAANLTTDVQLAAHAIENQAKLCSNDTDFGRFPELRGVDPLAG